ncbi:S8 family serine peptidase [Kineosporia sp. J2-2]|uniref:S8 family serine peptidase n=1 Tax=Kineosporia corallincola TaxID=2835133 RepID=A0ABS5TP35_9ACTN|nr:S8 family serine peptidase [Kineosporia corallincola]MBT0772865.1 S8 family serine peptidase [Kineosporia corallincola]
MARTAVLAVVTVATALVTATAPAVAATPPGTGSGAGSTDTTARAATEDTAPEDAGQTLDKVTTPATGTQRYLVQLDDAPVATYDGDVDGLAATKPAAGKRLSTGTAKVKAYREHLAGERSAVLKRAGVSSKATGAQLSTVFNGFVATLTPEQFTRVRATDGVAALYADRRVVADTWHSPEYLGLAGDDGVWQQQFGGAGDAGEGIIIGDLDSGFWPESPSLAAMPEPRPDAETIAKKWKGTCDAGQTGQITCNNKVIGARWYNDDGVAEAFPDEYFSPRDRNGHGTHTASTAAGLNGVAAIVGDQNLGTISGMAPGARLAVYKVLYDNGAGSASGSSIDIVNAIDDAVSDGVDVINYSIGDGTDRIGAVDLAFFNAAAAGVFVSASAGNEGPDDSTVDNSMPWVTTVAASTTDREFQRRLTLGDGTVIDGIGMGSASVASAPLVDSAAVAADPDDVSSAQLCDTGSLDPAKVKGSIVFCLRGVIDRVAKSRTVADAGGVGMVLYNDVTNSLNADVHSVPTVHIDDRQAPVVAAYIAKGDATAEISASRTAEVDSPSIAGFSSSGPSGVNETDLLKPDISAPGVDVVAATSPARGGEDFALMSGTSMAAPHIAGIAALVRAQHPDWSPAQVRSAMMTTAGDTTRAGKPIQVGDADATPFNYGSGEVRPGSALDPGLVFDSTSADWLRYLCGIAPSVSTLCDSTDTLDVNQLNYPSISMGHMVGTQTVTRTVTNVGSRTAHYVSQVSAPQGYTVKVTPAAININPGKTATFKVTVTNVSGAYGTWADGRLTWKDQDGHAVGLPLLVHNTGLVTPDAVVGTGTKGSQVVQVQAGYKGALTAGVYGLTSGTSSTTTLIGRQPSWDWGSLDNLPSPLPASLGVQQVHIPAGSVNPQVFVAVGMTTCTGNGGGDDEDPPPCVDYTIDAYGPDGKAIITAVGSKNGATLDLPDGEGDYTVVIQQEFFENTPAGQDFATYTTTVYTPGAAGTSTGKLTVDPKNRTVVQGATANLTVRWSGLSTGSRYVGLLRIGDGRGTTKELPITVVP